MKTKYFFVLYFLVFLFFLLFFISNISFAGDPKLINTLNNAFEKIENYIIKLSTPAAAVAVGSGVLMKKFSFGDEEKIRISKKLIRGSLFSYGFILCIDLILSLIKNLLS